MQIELNEIDIYNFKKFMFTKSKQANSYRNLAMFVVIWFVFIGILVDLFAKTMPIITIVSFFFGIAFYLLFPKLYRAILLKNLGLRPANPGKISKMNFELFEDRFSYSLGSGKAKASETFKFSELTEILESDDNYFLGINYGKNYICLPKTELVKSAIDELKSERKLEITEIKI